MHLLKFQVQKSLGQIEMDEVEVSVYIDSIIAPYCEIDINHSYCNRDLEIISINVNKPGLKYMFVSAIYRPPRGNIKGCIDRLQEIFSTRQNSKKKFWLLGDCRLFGSKCIQQK